MSEEGGRSADRLFSEAIERSRGYRRKTPIGAAFSQLLTGSLFKKAHRAWQVFRPTLILTRVFRVLTAIVGFVERSALLIAASATLLFLIPPIIVLLLVSAAFSFAGCKRSYASLLQLDGIKEKGVLALFADSLAGIESEQGCRVAALADGRVCVVISRGRLGKRKAPTDTRVLYGGDIFLFYLRHRAKRDGIPLWIIY